MAPHKIMNTKSLGCLALLFMAIVGLAADAVKPVTLCWRNESLQSPADQVEIWTSEKLAPMGPDWKLLAVTNAWWPVVAIQPGNAVFTLWVPATNDWFAVYDDVETGRLYTNQVTLRTNLEIQVSTEHSSFFVIRYRGKLGVGPFSEAAQAAAVPTNSWLWIQ
jgi:hypothetical protein